MHPFDEAIQLTPCGEHGFAGTILATYANMVGPFGGLTNALMLNAALLHPARRGEVIALTVNFAAPIAAGGFVIEASPSRTNRSTQHWTLRFVQQDETVAAGTAVFAVRRETWSAQEALAPQDLPPPESLPRLSAAGLPAWIGRYDIRFAAGGLSLDGRIQPDSVTQLWVRDEPPRPLSFTSLAALCDCFYPRIFRRRHRAVPAGTVTMTTYFHADAAQLAAQSDRYLVGAARGLQFRNGYADQTAQIWGDAGELLASSNQLVYYRE